MEIGSLASCQFLICCKHIWCKFQIRAPEQRHRERDLFRLWCSIHFHSYRQNLFGECWTSVFLSLSWLCSLSRAQLVAIVYACEPSVHFIIRVGFYVSISVRLKVSFRKILFYSWNWYKVNAVGMCFFLYHTLARIGIFCSFYLNWNSRTSFWQGIMAVLFCIQNKIHCFFSIT